MRLLPRLLLALLTIAAFAASASAANPIVAGPVVGNVTDKSARLWMQFSTSVTVNIKCFEVESGQEVSGITTDVEGPSPFICDTPISNLQPNKNYRIELKIDGVPTKPTGPAVALRTFPPPGDASTFSIAFGSCTKPEGKGSLPIFQAITETKPRAFIFLGDNGYLPGKLSDFPEKRRDAFRFLCDFHSKFKQEPDLQELFRTVPSYATWDDHDFGTNDANRTWVFAKEAQVAFQRFWPNPDWGQPANPGTYFSFTLSDADFFILDARMFRDPDPDPKRHTILGEKQFAWLQSSLKKSTATFKIIALGSQCIANYSKFDSWAHYPEQKEFLDWLLQEQIPGVLFISGDRHMGELTIKSPDEKTPHAYPLVDLTSSPLHAKLASPDTVALKNPDRSGNAVVENNFGTLDFGGPAGKRFITLRLRDEKGKPLVEQTIFASQLRSK